MEFGEIISRILEIFNYTIFEINNKPISIFSILMFIAVMIAVIQSSKIFNRYILKRMLATLQIEKSVQFAISRILSYAVITIGAIIAFQFIGIDLSGLAVIFGFLSVGIGFGLQNITSNFISGLILLFERPIKVGDRVIVGGTEGDVLDINIRSTTIRSVQNVSIIVPNTEFISSNVINLSHGDQRTKIYADVGVSYNSDLDLVLKVLKDIAVNNEKILKNPEPVVLFRNFGDSSWNLTLIAWVAVPKNAVDVKSDINCEIVRQFRKNNIEIPFPQQDLHIRSAEKIRIENTPIKE